MATLRKSSRKFLLLSWNKTNDVNAPLAQVDGHDHRAMDEMDEENSNSAQPAAEEGGAETQKDSSNTSFAAAAAAAAAGTAAASSPSSVRLRSTSNLSQQLGRRLSVGGGLSASSKASSELSRSSLCASFRGLKEASYPVIWRGRVAVDNLEVLQPLTLELADALQKSGILATHTELCARLRSHRGRCFSNPQLDMDRAIGGEAYARRRELLLDMAVDFGCQPLSTPFLELLERSSAPLKQLQALPPPTFAETEDASIGSRRHAASAATTRRSSAP